jgi:hypothetical protein
MQIFASLVTSSPNACEPLAMNGSAANQNHFFRPFSIATVIAAECQRPLDRWSSDNFGAI